jgi:hypothetical protein
VYDKKQIFFTLPSLPVPGKMSPSLTVPVTENLLPKKSPPKPSPSPGKQFKANGEQQEKEKGASGSGQGKLAVVFTNSQLPPLPPLPKSQMTEKEKKEKNGYSFF